MPTLVHARPWATGVWVLGLALAGFACGADSGTSPPPPPLPPPPPPAGVIATVTVDTLTRFQVMTGWEASADAALGHPDVELWRDDMIRLAVTDLGLNRLRLELRNGSENPVDNYTEFQQGRLTNQEWRCKRYTTINDNSDPTVIAPAGFYWTEMDRKVEKLVLPMKQRLEAQGETLVLSLTYVAFLHQCGSPIPPYPHGDPAEYAEFVLATFLHLQQQYGLVPTNVEILLEPDNTGAMSPWNGNGTAIGQAIVATGQRLAAAGFHPKFTVPSTKSMSNAIIYFDDLIKVPGVLPFIGEIAYHRYADVSDVNLTALADRGRANGVKTAMLEHIGSGVEDLYKDLVLGRASAWEQFTMAYALADDGAQYYVIVNNQPVLGIRSRYLRQYFRYVRLGAQRVGAVSDNAQVRPVAFVNQNGKTAVVIHVANAGSIFVRGLRPGTYGTSVTTDAATGTELGNQVVGPFGTMVVAAPAGSVLTVYRK